MKIAYILCGLPGSGKSTWVKHNLGIKVISRDEIRARLGYTKSVDEKCILDYHKEEKVTEIFNEDLKNAIIDNLSIVIDNINYKRYRTPLIEKLRKEGYKVIGVNIYTPIEICKSRRPQIDNYDRIVRRFVFIEPHEVDEMVVTFGY